MLTDSMPSCLFLQIIGKKNGFYNILVLVDNLINLWGFFIK